MITIIVPVTTVVRGGVLHDSAADLILARGGIKRETIGDKIYYTNVPPETDIQILDVAGIITAGGMLYGQPMFIRMASTTYNSDVPSYVPNATYVDENEQTITRKWSEWKDETHSHIDSNDGTEFIVPGNSWGAELDGSVVSQLYNDGSALYATIYNLKEMRDILLTDPNFTTQGV